MVKAVWNGMKFEVTESAYATISNPRPAYKASGEKRALHELSVTVTYAVAAGHADVRSMLGRWGKLVGTSAPFILGTHAFLAGKFKLKQASLTGCELDTRGLMMTADIELSFIEDPKK